MKYTYRPVMVTILAVSLSSFCFSDAGLELTHSEIESAKKKVVKALCSIESFEKEKGLSGAEIVPSIAKFDEATGLCLTFISPGLSSKISIHDERVFKVILHKNQPRTFPPLDQNFRIIPFDKLASENTNIEPDAARRTAEDVARSLFGEHVLENLYEVQAELARNGNWFGYSYMWKKTPEGSEISFGFDEISIWINPQTGSLYSVSRYRFEPRWNPNVTADLARQLVIDSFGPEGFPISIKSIGLITRYDREGGLHPTWHVSVTQDQPNRFGTPILRTLEINAASGEVSVDPVLQPPFFQEIPYSEKEIPKN